MATAGAWIKVAACNQYFFSNTLSNDLIIYTGLPTQKILFGTSNTTSILSLSSNIITTGANIIPYSNNTYSLGTSNLRFKDLFLGSNSLYLGNTKFSCDSSGTVSLTDYITGSNQAITVQQIQLGSACNSVILTYNSNNNQLLLNTYSNGSLTGQASAGGGGWSNTSSNVYIIGSNVGIGKSNPGYPLDITGDLNFTGILRQGGTPYVGSQWSNNSSNVFLFGSNVGIGTSNPGYLLDVNGDIAVRCNLNLINKSISIGGLTITQDNGISANVTTVVNAVPGFSNEGSNSLLYISSNSASNYIRFMASNTELIRLTGDGKFGIGTSNPASELNIVGSAIIGSNYVTNSPGYIQMGTMGSNGTYISLNQGSVAMFNSSSNWPQYGIGMNNLGIVRLNSFVQLQFGTHGGPMWFDTSFGGKVGVGISNPAYPLDVNGNINCSSNISAGNLGMFRNRVINGDMRIAQRGASIVNGTGIITSYSLDRFCVLYSITTGGLTQSQQTLTTSDTPYQYGFKYSYRITASTANSSYSWIIPTHNIEGLNISDLNWGTTFGSSITVSFWARTNAGNNTIFALTLRNSNINYSYNVPFTLTTSGTWQFFSAVIPAPPNGSVWNIDNSIGIGIFFAGYQSTGLSSSPNTWQNGNFVGTTTCTNIYATLNNYIEFTGVQLEKGTIVTPFEFRPYSIELSLCQRYYEIISNLYLPVAGCTNTGNSTLGGSATANGGGQFLISKRSLPSCSITNINSGIASYGGGAGNPSFTIYSSNVNNWGVYASGSGAYNVYGLYVGCIISISANAEL